LSEDGKMHGKAGMHLNSGNLYIKGELDTFEEGKASGKAQYFMGSTGFSFISQFTADLAPLKLPPPALGVSFSSPNRSFSFESFARADGIVGGWAVLKVAEKWFFGVNGQHFLRPFAPDYFPPSIKLRPVVDLVFSYRSVDVVLPPLLPNIKQTIDSSKNFISRALTSVPSQDVPSSSFSPNVDFFDLTFKLRELGKKFEFSYMQHMVMPFKTTGFSHHVTLGGTFEHAMEDNAKETNVMTVGGSWQVSARELIKAKISTSGKVGLLYGVRLGNYPSATVSCGVDVDAAKSTFGLGVNIFIED